FGMQTMNDSLYALYMNREVALDDCLRASHDPTEFLRMIGQTSEDDAKKAGSPAMANGPMARR
ncbi:MAG: pilT, partial [Gemmatimonadetes bacterium]|nr:pilT [Gemmatimonadota bacterium]